MHNAFRDPYTWVLCALLAAFVAFKWSYLGLPYFWDEAWVYAPAVQAMHAHGPSLLPDALPPELSRGHPLLFHFLASLWMVPFGSSIASAHAFALTVSVVLLVLTYVIGTTLGDRWVGLGAVGLLLVNEMFLAQSAILLPEVLLALFVLVAVWAYARRRPWIYVGAATCALLVKESAVVLVLAVFGWHLLRSIVPPVSMPRRERWRWGGLALLPLGLAGCFFVYQRIRLGWFFYPDHLGLITWAERDITYKVRLAFHDLFEDQGRAVLAYAFAFGVPVLWKGWDRRWSALVVLLYVAAVKVLFGLWSLPGDWTLIVPGLCLAIIAGSLFIRFQQREEAQGDLAGIGFLFVAGFLLFSGLNFFSDRYLLCAFPLIYVGALLFLRTALAWLPRWVFPAVVLIATASMGVRIGRNTAIGDTRLNYADAVRLHQQLVAFGTSEKLQGEVIRTAFLEYYAMTHPQAGYLNGQAPFTQVELDPTDQAHYLIITSLSPPEVMALRGRPEWVLWKTFRQGVAWGELYRKRI